MNDIAIRVENLGKQYRIGSAQQARYKTLRDSLTDMVTAPRLFAPPSSTGGDAPR
jgi:hypothetical protein